MKKVCQVIKSSAEHEARIKRAVPALKNAGYAVSVIGCTDETYTKSVQFLSSGILIRRVQMDRLKIKTAKSKCVKKVFGNMCLILLLIFIFHWLGQNFKFMQWPYFPLSQILSAFVLAWGSVLSFYSIRYYRDLKKRLSHNIIEDKTSNNDLKLKLPLPLNDYEKEVFKLLCGEKPDIVQAHDIETLKVCVCYKRVFACRLIYDAHELHEACAYLSDQEKRQAREMLLKFSPEIDLFITVNDSIAQYYSDHYPGLKPLVIKNASLPAGEIRYDGRLHKAAGLPADKKIIIYQGMYSNSRGLFELAQAAGMLHPDLAVVFMGLGEAGQELERLVAELAIENPRINDSVKFVPKAKWEELALWTAGATIGIIPFKNICLNHWFCTPNKLWEYPNAGVPILGVNFPEIEKVISKYKVGWLLSENYSPEDLAHILNSLTDEEISQAKGNCHQFIQEDNWNIYAERLINAYRDLNLSA